MAITRPTGDRAAAEQADRDRVATYRAEHDNRQRLTMLLSERRGRYDPAVRAEIGQRIVADLQKCAQDDHPGMTRRERLFPNAPRIDPRRDHREAAEAKYRQARIAPAVAAYLAGTSDRCSLADYQAAVAPVVRWVREAMGRGVDAGQAAVGRYAYLWNAYWIRAFEADLRAAGGFPDPVDAVRVDAEEL